MNSKEPTILIVDDDISICQSLGLILEKNGYDVEMALCGKEAIEKSRKTAFNVALLDIRLPDTEGTKLLKLLDETTPKIIKIMVTGSPELRNAVEALNHGADAYLTKPVHPEELLKTIEEKLKEQEQAEYVTEEKITDFLQTRTKKLLQGLR
jgi:two-component system response regulator HydG